MLGRSSRVDLAGRDAGRGSLLEKLVDVEERRRPKLPVARLCMTAYADWKSCMHVK